MSETKIVYPQAPKELFEEQRVENLKLGEEAPVPLLDNDENGNVLIQFIQDKGIFSCYKGVPYKRKGFITPDILYALNNIKTVIIEFVKCLKNPFFALGVILTKKSALIERYNQVHFKMFRFNSTSLNIAERFAAPYTLGMSKFVRGVCLSLGIEESLATKFGTNLSQIIEYDDAYRSRIQDIMTELNVTSFSENPRKEIKRLVELWIEREQTGVKFKLHSFIDPILFILLVPKIKHAFIQNVSYLKQMEYDEDDKYWAYIRKGYDYGGMSYEERTKDLPMPTFIMVKV